MYQLAEPSVLTFSAVIFSDNFTGLLHPLLCALDQIRQQCCATFPGGSHGTQKICREWCISENSPDPIFFYPDFHCWCWLPDWLHLRPAVKQYMSLGLRWDVGTQTLVCPVWLRSATCLCTFLFFTEPGVGLGIGACCLTLENSSPGIYIHSLAPGSVAKMDGRLRLVKPETCSSGFTIQSIETLFSLIGSCSREGIYSWRVHQKENI